MRKGINIWSFRDQHNLPGCMELAREAGFEGIELAYALDGPISPEASPDDMRRIAQAAAETGIEIPSLAAGMLWQFNLVSDDPDVRAASKGHIRKALALAGALGADTLLIVPGFTGPFLSGPPAVADYGAAYERALQALQELGPEGERRGVFIGVENVWNRFLGGPIEMRDFIDRVGHPYVQCFFDVGNVLRTGYPQHWIRVLGERIKKVHFKDYRIDVGTLAGFVDLLSGDVDYPAVMQALRDIGYDGWCIAEIRRREHWPESTLTVTSQAMDLILGWA